jgi:hypothetical protein
VMLEQVTEKGIAALAKLEHLQEFFYRGKYCLGRDRYFQLCLERLPRLRLSSFRIKIELETDSRLTKFATKAFQRLKTPLPSALALRQLVLKNSPVMPVGVVMPNLETLYVIRPGRKFSLLGLLSVTELGLEQLLQGQFEQILSSIGHQLLSLAVKVWDTLFVDKVFQLCPKLQKFYITDLPETFVGLKEPLNVHKCLIEFGFTEMSFESQKKHFQPEHLLQILQAVPNLRVWRMKNYLFNEQELVLVGEALEQNSILQNLEQFQLVYVVVFKDELVVTGMEVSDVMLNSLIEHCPKLSTVKVEQDID